MTVIKMEERGNFGNRGTMVKVFSAAKRRKLGFDTYWFLFLPNDWADFVNAADPC